jgi:hypothetical protein
MAKVTLRDAARLVGRNRATLYRYIADGTLSVEQETRGRQRVRVVDTAELERVFGPLGDPERRSATVEMRPAATAPETVALRGEVDALRRENELLRRQLEETRGDKERLFRLLEDRRPPERPWRPWPGLRAWWRRMRGGEA